MTVLLPEYRQIELYSKKKSLAIAEDAEAERVEATRTCAALSDAFGALDAALGDPLDDPDPMAAWRKYQRLDRSSAVGKLTAEAYRALRVFRAALTHETGRVETRNGLIKATATVEQTALSIRITKIGADLLDSFVAYRLGADRLPYSESYVTAMLCRYWSDISEEIRWYYDEDRVLFQFRDEFGLNRHFRFECDNPRFSVGADHIRFDLGEMYTDPLRYPIDLYVVINTQLHIIPVEALNAGRLALDQLPRWQARLPDGLTLPASYRLRFTREVMAQGLPMT